MSHSPAPGCNVPATELLAWRDQELAPAAAVALAEHVASCPACQAHLAATTHLTTVLQAGSPRHDSPIGRAAVHAALARHRRPWWLLPALRGAALSTLLVLLVALGLRWWAMERDCPTCDPPPAGPRITQIAGLPARMAAPHLLCVAPVRTAPDIASEHPRANAAPTNQPRPGNPGHTLVGSGGDPRPAPPDAASNQATVNRPVAEPWFRPPGPGTAVNLPGCGPRAGVIEYLVAGSPGRAGN